MERIYYRHCVWKVFAGVGDVRVIHVADQILHSEPLLFGDRGKVWLCDVVSSGMKHVYCLTGMEVLYY